MAAIAWVLVGAGALTDPFTPLGFAHPPLFAIAVLLTAESGRRSTVALIAAASLALTAVGIFTSPPTPETAGVSLTIANRAVYMLLIVVSAILASRTVSSTHRERVRLAEIQGLADARARDARLMAIAGSTASVGGWSVDVPTMTATWSDEVARIHGEPPGTSPSVDRALDYYHPEDRPLIAAEVEACLRTGAAFDVELRLLQAGGREQRWVRATGRAVRDDAGSIVALEGAFQDVTHRIEAEHALVAATEAERRRSEEVVAMLGRISDAFFALDADWRFGFVNAQAERLLGRAAVDLEGRSVWEEFPGAIGSPFERHYRAARATGTTVQFEAYYEPMERWFEVRAHPTDDALAVFFQDVTDRRAATARTKLLEAAIDQLEEIVMITEAEPVAPEPHPRVVYVNTAFERITGYRKDEIYGRSPRLLQGEDTDPVERSRIRAALDAWSPVRATLLNYRKDGSPMWIDLHIVPVADGTGWYTHWIAVERDVTEERAQAARWAMAQRMESVGQLTGGMAHDFNNLLTVMGGSADLLRSRLEEPSVERRLADTILIATERGAKLTQSMLAFARRQPLDPKPVDALAALDSMRILLERTLGEDVDLQFDAPQHERITTFVDPHQLESALLNLILNARDAMPNGGKVTVEVRRVVLDEEYAARHDEVAAGAYVAFAVSDTGVGIAPDQMPRVFEPFFTTKALGSGSGLGLAMVFGFAKQSRGHVSIYSELGEGTTVRLYLPDHEAVATEAPAPFSSDLDDLRGRETIVVVEDDPLVRAFAVEQLRAFGYAVHEARTGAEALAALETLPATDLLFTDVVMPGGMNGRQLADAAVERHPHLRVLFTSGYTENAIVHHGRLDAGVDLLTKPYRRAELARRVRAVLDAPRRTD